MSRNVTASSHSAISARASAAIRAGCPRLLLHATSGPSTLTRIGPSMLAETGPSADGGARRERRAPSRRKHCIGPSRWSAPGVGDATMERGVQTPSGSARPRGSPARRAARRSARKPASAEVPGRDHARGADVARRRRVAVTGGARPARTRGRGRTGARA
jgi:hypothetical protein